MVSIGYIHNGVVRHEFMLSLMALMTYDSATDRRIIGNWIWGDGLYLAENRNRVVRRFLELGEDEWLLFVDSDIDFEPEAVYRLLAKADPVKRPIISALYFTFMLSFKDRTGISPTWLVRRPEGDYTIPNIEAESPQELGAVGMGFCLIHRSALEKIGKEHEKDPHQWFGHDLIESTEGRRIRLGEDLTFCDRAFKLGITTWGCSDIRVGHTKTGKVTYDSFVRDQTFYRDFRPVVHTSCMESVGQSSPTGAGLLARER